MMISIIIPALNEERNIGRCLASIERTVTPKNLFEVIVMDNGSIDRTCSIAERFTDKLNISVFILKGVSIATLRNMGASYSKGDVLAFLDADCTVSENWMNNALRYFDDDSIGAVGSSHIIPDVASWVARTWDLNIARKRTKGFTDSLPSGNLFVDKKKFNEIKGFDDSLTTNEDFDLCFRLRDQGYKIYADPQITAVHWGIPSNLKEFYKQTRWHGTNVLKVFLRDIRSLNNIRAVLYGLYYAVCILGLAVSFIIVTSSCIFVYLITFTIALISPPFILSINTLRKNGKTFSQCLQLSILYLIYGIARAHSLLDNFRERI